ncbi:uncharacterized protein IUM83_02673 [Phytophthora cinnamomi]|uniref:uncharacterized protein n=1 Tax=Phytophthora cinnamomi TaxID=4785 RepID=UPI003559B729|nr:hypothetical protein IUM83_02673 [Phytophthora cinnamomi]
MIAYASRARPVPACTTSVSPNPHSKPVGRGKPRRTAHRRNGPDRPGGYPEHIRHLIPRNGDGIKPYLKFFGGGMYEGGTRDTCAAQGQTHVWPSALPSTPIVFITKRFGGRRVSRPGRMRVPRSRRYTGAPDSTQ